MVLTGKIRVLPFGRYLLVAYAPGGNGAAGFVEHATPQQLAGIAKDNSRHFGDDPDDGGPIATDLVGFARLRPRWERRCVRLGTGSWRGRRSTSTGYGRGACFIAGLWRLRIRWAM